MPAESAHPRPIPSLEVPWEEWSPVPRFGTRWKHLTRAAIGSEHYRVGVAIEELAPGKQSSPAHYHVFEEEHVYILEGGLTLRLGSDRHEMKAGDYVCFPAGQRAGHCLINESGTTCRYVIVGEQNPNEVVVYTDSRKVLVRALGQRAMFDMTATRDYWDGENTGVTNLQIPPTDCVTVPAAVKPNPPISSIDVPWEDENTPAGTRFGGSAKHLTYAAVAERYRVGMLIEAPASGKRLAPRHYHMLEEEHALILEGQVTLLLDEEQYELRAGDYVCFPAGLRVGHSFLNSGPGPCSYLMIGERNPNDVCVYPDSNKVDVKALRTKDSILDLSGVRGYWDGE